MQQQVSPAVVVVVLIVVVLVLIAAWHFIYGKQTKQEPETPENMLTPDEPMPADVEPAPPSDEAPAANQPEPETTGDEPAPDEES